MKFYEAIAYAEKGFLVKPVVDLEYMSLEQIKSQDFSKEEMFESDWEIQKPELLPVPCWVKLVNGKYCYLTANADEQNPALYVARCMETGNRLYLNQSDIQCMVEFNEI